jgi:MYXO-CTERM domain-containing protein
METEPPSEDPEGSESASDEGEGDDAGDDEAFEPSGCEGTGVFYCEIQEISCTDSADCPADWDCLENPEEAVSVSMAVPCDVDDEGNEDCPEPVAVPEEPADISSLCFPPGYEDYASWGEGDLSASVENASDNSGTSTSAGPSDPGGELEEDATDKASSSSSDDGGCAGGPQPLSAIWLALALVALAVRRREPIQH